MSDAGLSTAHVVKVKGVSLNYLQFLWTNIQDFRKAHASGDYATALDKAVELIYYLPDTIKEKHRKRSVEIQVVMRNIANCVYPELQKIPDLWIKGITRHRLLQTYAREALLEFVDQVTTDLNALGYMESVKPVPEGSMEDTPDWIKKQQKEQESDAETKEKGKAKPDAPEGTMD